MLDCAFCDSYLITYILQDYVRNRCLWMIIMIDHILYRVQMKMTSLFHTRFCDLPTNYLVIKDSNFDQFWGQGVVGLICSRRVQFWHNVELQDPN